MNNQAIVLDEKGKLILVLLEDQGSLQIRLIEGEHHYEDYYVASKTICLDKRQTMALHQALANKINLPAPVVRN